VAIILTTACLLIEEDFIDIGGPNSKMATVITVISHGYFFMDLLAWVWYGISIHK